MQNLNPVVKLTLHHPRSAFTKLHTFYALSIVFNAIPKITKSALKAAKTCLFISEAHASIFVEKQSSVYNRCNKWQSAERDAKLCYLSNPTAHALQGRRVQNGWSWSVCVITAVLFKAATKQSPPGHGRVVSNSPKCNNHAKLAYLAAQLRSLRLGSIFFIFLS